MTKAPGDLREFKEILDRKEAELVRSSRKGNNIAIEKSPDQIDELQHTATLDLAIQDLDREFNMLRDVKGALLRLEDGSFGTCTQCEWSISPKRLAAVPWAPLCIECQEAADREKYEATGSLVETRMKAA